MIYTITFNPAVDVYMRLRDAKHISGLNRAYKETHRPGGKGINVSRVLHALGTKSIAVGFVGGYTGHFIEEQINKENIVTDFVHINDTTRLNTKLLFDNGEMVEINGPSPIITKQDILNLARKFAKVKKDDTVIISGNLGENFSLSLFDNLLKIIVSKKATLICDMSGRPFLRTLKYHPFMVKPNNHELEEVLFTSLKSDDDLIRGAKRLVKMGAQNVIVSMGKSGAILVNEDITCRVKAPVGKAINPVGAGDALVAAFTDDYIKNKDVIKALKRGVVVSAAKVFSNDLANEKLIKELSEKVK